MFMVIGAAPMPSSSSASETASDTLAWLIPLGLLLSGAAVAVMPKNPGLSPDDPDSGPPTAAILHAEGGPRTREDSTSATTVTSVRRRPGAGQPASSPSPSSHSPPPSEADDEASYEAFKTNRARARLACDGLVVVALVVAILLVLRTSYDMDVGGELRLAFPREVGLVERLVRGLAGARG
jgi:hypothetical protein